MVKLFLFLPFVFMLAKNANSAPTKDCAWMNDNFPDDDPSFYSIREDCLYYKIKSDEKKRMKKSSSLKEYPPIDPENAEEKIQVLISEISLKKLDFHSPSPHEADIVGTLSASWIDYRFKWNQYKWKLDKFRIKSASHIWIPENNMLQLRYDTSFTAFFEDIIVSHKGNVTCTIKFIIENSHCQLDHADFPVETTKCCGTIGTSHTMSENRRYILPITGGRFLTGKTGTKNDSFVQKWKVEKFFARYDNEVQNVEVCVEVTRSSQLLKSEVGVPLAASTFFVFLSPFFGSMLKQVYAKMFTVAFQTFCYTTMLSGVDSEWVFTVPKICRIYEISIGFTLFSILVTLVLHSMSDRQRNLPPAHQIQLFANYFNDKFIFKTDPSSTADLKEAGQNLPNSFTQDWNGVFTACNNLLSVVLILIYVLSVFFVYF